MTTNKPLATLMVFIQRLKMSSAGNHQNRSHQRSLLREAARGDKQKFTLLAEPYLDLVAEYLSLSGITGEREIRKKSAHILKEAWRFLPFLHNVHDFERLLATSLFSIAPTRQNRFAQNRAVLELDPRERFALVANDLESWDKRWTTAALKVTRKELDATLVRVRCRLVSIDTHLLDEANHKGICRVSLELDDGCSAKEKQKFSQRLALLPQAKEFKRRWLDYRCQLIETRQQVRLSTEAREALFQELENELCPTQMIRVPLLDRFVGRLTFRETSLSHP